MFNWCVLINYPFFLCLQLFQRPPIGSLHCLLFTDVSSSSFVSLMFLSTPTHPFPASSFPSFTISWWNSFRYLLIKLILWNSLPINEFGTSILLQIWSLNRSQSPSSLTVTLLHDLIWKLTRYHFQFLVNTRLCSNFFLLFCVLCQLTFFEFSQVLVTEISL